MIKVRAPEEPPPPLLQRNGDMVASGIADVLETTAALQRKWANKWARDTREPDDQDFSRCACHVAIFIMHVLLANVLRIEQEVYQEVC